MESRSAGEVGFGKGKPFGREFPSRAIFEIHFVGGTSVSNLLSRFDLALGIRSAIFAI